MKEIWRDIKDYEGKYQVSNLGNVKSLNYNKTGKERLLNLRKSSGYLRVTLSKNNKSKTYIVHRLVAEAFLNKNDFKYVDEEDRLNNLDLENLEVNHIKEFEKENNCIENLEWCTSKYNSFYGTRLERIVKANTNHPNKSKKVYQYNLDGNFIREWPSANEAGRQLSYNQGHISECCRGKYKQMYGYVWSYKKTTNIEKGGCDEC